MTNYLNFLNPFEGWDKTPAFILLSFLALMACKDNSKSEAESQSEWFHGKVTYQYSYESEKLDVDSLALAKPHTGVMIFEGNNYKSIFYGQDTFTYVYLGDINQCAQFSGANTFEGCEDYSQPTDSILHFKNYKTEEKILEQDCQILEFQSRYFWNRYYVSKKIKLDPRAYKDHLAYNWRFYGDQTKGGLILKLEHRFKNYIMKGIAVKVDFFPQEKQVIDTQLASSFCVKKQ